jgi:hypothetical protein
MAGEGPTTTIGQTGVLKKIVDRTARAWVDIQAGKPYWKFLRSSLSFTLVSAQRTYTVSAALPTGFALTTVDKWDKQSSFIYTTSTSDESPLKWIPYQDFRRQYRTFQSGRPTQLTEGPDGTVSFNRTPDAAYVITLDYWKTPELLQNPTEVPAAPEQYHDVIVWRSVMMFAGNEMATDLYSYAKSMFAPMYLQLCLDQMDAPVTMRNYPLALGGRRSPQTFEDAR